MVILDFCGECCALLRPGTGKLPVPRCNNCGALVKNRDARIQGHFMEGEAQRMVFGNFGLDRAVFGEGNL